MTFSRRSMILAGAATLAGCARADGSPRFLTYDGPAVTGIVAWKERRRMVLMHNETILRDYHIELGFTPQGHKQFEGDGKTPEGFYWVDRKNARSRYHLSVGVSYPNDQDRAYAHAQGRSPGGDIFFHGTPRRYRNATDWTAGCMAITNEEVEEMYAMVALGTPMMILP